MATRKAQIRLTVFAHENYDQPCFTGWNEYPIQPHEKPVSHHRVVGKSVVYDVVSWDFEFGYHEACKYAVDFHERAVTIRLHE